MRNLIAKVKESPHQSSTQLRDSLTKAGLLSALSGRMLNPWEKGKGTFRGMMKAEHGSKFKIPVGGETIQIHAPSKHTLFVNYCKDCIGFMSLVFHWNREV